jgi:CBS domain containing-hemolysin-like protein
MVSNISADLSSFATVILSYMPPSVPALWIWIGIVLCIVQSALLSGLNLAVFSLSQLRLQLEADGGNDDAARVLELRRNSNNVLATVIWGNVSTTVLLTLLSDSVLAGIGAFLFSAVAITLFGEIFPQAYFSRNALRMTALFSPFLNFYRGVLYPLAKPTALLLDWWLGREGIACLAERDLRSLLLRSAASGGDIGRLLRGIATVDGGLAAANPLTAQSGSA